MMKVNYKELYLSLLQQKKALEAKVNPAESESTNEIPADFNQIGWELTELKVATMLAKMQELKAARGKRLTPQFYRGICNRAMIAINEIEKMLESLSIKDDKTTDYEAECAKLNSEIYALNQQLQN